MSNELDRHRADVVLVNADGLIHRPHTASADLPNDLIRTDTPADLRIRIVPLHLHRECGGRMPYGVADGAPCTLRLSVTLQQDFDLSAQFAVILALRIEVCA